MEADYSDPGGPERVMNMPNDNIFKKAKQLLRDKPVSEMNDEELLTVKAATIPLLQLPMFNDLTIDEGLEELAEIVDEANREKVASRGRAVVARQASIT